ncbi:MAG: hypothetical protein Kow0060_23290 [Methylohalobius crimeensis]
MNESVTQRMPFVLAKKKAGGQESGLSTKKLQKKAYGVRSCIPTFMRAYKSDGQTPDSGTAVTPASPL